MDVSWPRGRYLVELMEGSTKARTEKDTIKALRSAKERLDQEIATLTKKRDSLRASLKRICNHPLQQLRVAESQGEDGFTYTVTCSCGGATLRVHKKEI